ncbi:hypothetical protein, partial [Helicobacter pylori]|uniref:hypothetical protein n=1 Tax=Helicobacter pylori TaxID=210 RepID=UPI001E5BD2C9
MAVRFGVIFITDNYTIDSVSQISQYQISHYCLNFQRIYQKPLMKYHNFLTNFKNSKIHNLQTLKIQKSTMKKFHFRHQKIIHHY